MHPERMENLKAEYTDQYVIVDETRPELARFKGLVGQVRTINFNGRALVQFDGAGNRGRYDIELDYLKVVDKPQPKPPPEKKKPAAKPAAAKPSGAKPAADETEKPPEKLSPLELARMEKETKKPEAS